MSGFVQILGGSRLCLFFLFLQLVVAVVVVQSADETKKIAERSQDDLVDDAKALIKFPIEQVVLYDALLAVGADTCASVNVVNIGPKSTTPNTAVIDVKKIQQLRHELLEKNPVEMQMWQYIKNMEPVLELLKTLNVILYNTKRWDDFRKNKNHKDLIVRAMEALQVSGGWNSHSKLNKQIFALMNHVELQTSCVGTRFHMGRVELLLRNAAVIRTTCEIVFPKQIEEPYASECKNLLPVYTDLLTRAFHAQHEWKNRFLSIYAKTSKALPDTDGNEIIKTLVTQSMTSTKAFVVEVEALSSKIEKYYYHAVNNLLPSNFKKVNDLAAVKPTQGEDAEESTAKPKNLNWFQQLIQMGKQSSVVTLTAGVLGYLILVITLLLLKDCSGV